MERRNSSRIQTQDLSVQEKNGDYIFNLEVENLSEEGIFVRGKMVTEEHHYVSYLSFLLPGGPKLENIPAKVVRETFGPGRTGVAFHFVSMDEETRIKIKKFLNSATAA